VPNPCEKCPIREIIDNCCSSNPETGGSKTIKFKGQIISVCENLANDGSCSIYDERPEDCRAYVCERVYAIGLNSES